MQQGGLTFLSFGKLDELTPTPVLPEIMAVLNARTAGLAPRFRRVPGGSR